MSNTWKTFFKETLRGTWILSLCLMILLILVDLLPMIGRIINETEYINELMDSIFQMDGILYLGIISIFSMLAGIKAFSYLHHTASVTAVHMLPASRMTLFTSKVCGAACAVMVPTLINAIVMIIIAASAEYGDLFLVASRWILASFVIELFVIVITVLAGMLCGTVVTHLLGAATLIAVIPGSILVINFFCFKFLKGYMIPEIWENSFRWTNPIMSAFVTDEGLTSGLSVYFLIVTGLLALLAYKVFTIRPLEKATDGMAFDVVGTFVVFFVTLGAMSIIEEYLNLLSVKYVGLVLGFFVVFILTTMLVRKTTRIFNKRTFRNMGVSAVIIAAMITLIAVDFTNYNETNIKLNKVAYAETVVMNSYASFAPSPIDESLGTRFASQYFMEEGTENTIFKEKENIELVNKICKLYAANAKESNDMISLMYYSWFDHSNAEFIFSYNEYKNVYRYYSGMGAPKEAFEYIKKLYESDEFKETYRVGNMEDVKSYEIYFNKDSESNSKLNKKEKKQIIKLLDKDFKARKYEQEMVTASTYAGYIVLKNSKVAVFDEESSFVVPVRTIDKNTYKWLVDNGYLDELPYASEGISSVTIDHTIVDSDDSYQYATAELAAKHYKGMSVRELMDKYDGDLSQTTDNSDGYAMTINIKSKSDSDYGRSVTIYYPEDKVPSIIKNADYTVEEE